MSTTNVRLWRDPLFVAAIFAALAYWLALYAITGPKPDFGWPIRDPLRFVYPALLYPIIEEWIFRGFIQDLAQQRLHAWKLGPLSHANIYTSVLFTALHFIHHPPMWAAAVFVPSLVFGFFKDRTGRLTAPVALHIFYNSGYFWLFSQ